MIKFLLTFSLKKCLERHLFYQEKSRKLIMFEKTHKICILKKVNLVVLLNLCFRNHCLHMVLKDFGKDFFCCCWKIVWLIWQNVLLHWDILPVVLHLFFRKFFRRKVTHFFYFYLSIAVVWMNRKIENNNSQYLSHSKTHAQTFTIGWKNSMGLK